MTLFWSFLELLGSGVRSLLAALPPMATLYGLLIVGFVYVANIALNDYLSELIKWAANALKRSIRHMFRRKAGQFVADADFQIGSVQADIFILEYFPDGLASAQIACSLVHGADLVPPECQAEYLSETAEFDKQAEEGRVFAGKKLAVKEINITRIETTRAPILKMAFQATNYRHQTAMQNIFQRLPTDQKSQILKQPFIVDRIYSNTFGCNTVVITDDSRFLVAKRSPLVGPERRSVIFGIAEGMTDVDVLNYRTPDVRLTALRSLSRELGLPLGIENIDQIKLVSLSLNKKYYQYNFQGYIDLRGLGEQYSSSAIIKRIGQGRVADKFEYDEVTSLAFRVSEVVGFIKQNRENIANYSVVSAVYTLSKFYGWQSVEDACR